MSERPQMHCHAELEADLGYAGSLPDSIFWKWFQDQYSTSKHLFTLYSVARGLKARVIVEVGFGRSSFMLARAAAENGGRYFVCDHRDFSYLLNETERNVTTFVQGVSMDLWRKLPEPADLVFLDYFGSATFDEQTCRRDLESALAVLRTNGILAVHDTAELEFKIGQVITRLNPAGWRRFYQPDRVQWITLSYNYGLTLVRKIEPSIHGTIIDQQRKKPEL